MVHRDMLLWDSKQEEATKATYEALFDCTRSTAWRSARHRLTSRGHSLVYSIAIITSIIATIANAVRSCEQYYRQEVCRRGVNGCNNGM
jgi:hypothetical protein